MSVFLWIFIKNKGKSHWDGDLKLDKSHIWQDYWKQVNSLNEKLIRVCECGPYQVVEELFNFANQQNYYIDVNIKSLDDFTPLHYAITFNHLEIVKILIVKKANPEAKTSLGRTGLHLACI